MNIQIKCYLYPNSSTISPLTLSQSSEIRRFAVAADSTANLYAKLCEKIRAAYGSLIKPNDEIKTYWIDDENDLVCFSTDEETNFSIEMQTALSLSKIPSAKPLFKIYAGIKRANESFLNSDETQIHPGVVCDGCNDSIKGTRFNCAVCPDYDLCSVCKNKGIHHEHDFVVLNKPVRQRCPYGRRGKFFGSFNRHCQNQQQPASSSNSTNAQNPFSNIFPFISNAVPMVNDPEALKNFGEHLKKFLDPFGIDVSYYIDSNQKKKENEQNKQQQEEKKNKENTEYEKPQTSSSKNIPENESETLIDLSKEKVKLETCLSNESLPSFLYEKLSAQTETSNALESAANSLKEAIDSQKFVGFPNLPNIEKEDEKNNSIHEAEENGFNVVDIEKELKYIKCVEQLTNMGYTDEAGWLSRLVIAKDGNINNILDALQPSK